MAVAFVRAHTNQSNKTAGTTIDTGINAIVAAGNTMVVGLVFDNAAVASKPVVSSIAKAAGETNNWVFLGAARSTSTSAGSFASGELWALQTTVAWPVAVYNATFDSSITMKSATTLEMSGVTLTQRSTGGSAYSTTTTPASATTTGTTPVIGDLAIGLVFNSNAAGLNLLDSDTVGGAWSTSSVAPVGSTGGNATTNNWGYLTYKVLTAASHQTLNLSGVPTAGNGSIVVILQATPDPSITQASYRFYADGTETASTALAAQDTAATLDFTGTALIAVQLRVRLQSTTAVAVGATDDWQLQYERNASGSWLNIGGNEVQALNSANLTDAAATTNRLGAGTGSFVAGKVSETGIATDVGWTANNYTEVLFSLMLSGVDPSVLANGDTLRFRVLRNGVTTALTYTQTPTLSITKTSVAVTQTGYRFYADGAESASVALAAQNTATAVNVYSGDANMQLRVLLQSTTAVAIPTGDDWQLQYEKNVSGVWLDATAGGTAGATWPLSNGDGIYAIGKVASTRIGFAESFHGDGTTLGRVEFQLAKVGAPTGNTLTAQLWSHTGTYGSGTPGILLATSAAIDVATLPLTFGTISFRFDAPYTTLVTGDYFIGVFSSQVSTSDTDYVNIGNDTSGVYAGNGVSRTPTPAFGLLTAGNHIPFAIYVGGGGEVVPYDSASLTEGAVTTNRLTGGTGTFVAGEVTEASLVSNLGWSANNYTEVVYSLTVKASLRSNTVRFRVLRNGVTTSLTYTQVPTLAVLSAAFPITGLVGWWDADDAATITAGTGAKVATWADKSASVFAVTQATDANRPDRVLGNIQPGRYGLRYTANASLAGANPSGANQKPLTVFAIIRHDGTATNRAVVSTPSGGGFYLELGTTHKMQVNQQYVIGIAGSTTPVPINTTALLEFSYSATGDARFYLNGVADGTATNDQPFNSANPRVQFFEGIGQPFTGGDIGEVIKFDYVLSATDRQTVENYLIAKWITPPVLGLPKVWTGSAWVQKPLKVWTGAAWVQKPVKVWTGSVWKTVS